MALLYLITWSSDYFVAFGNIQCKNQVTLLEGFFFLFFFSSKIGHDRGVKVLGQPR